VYNILTHTGAGVWQRMTDESGQVYFYNKVLDKTQWDEPPAESRAWCTRFVLSLSLIAETQEQRCAIKAGSISLPPTLKLPGRLDAVNEQVKMGMSCL
jgi:hypothetical protein